LQGAAGGAFALVIVAALLAVLNSEVRPLADSYGSGFRFAFLSLSGAAAVLALSGGLGWLGAHLSVSRHLRQIEPR
jgi:cell division transport system permease protein